MTYTEALDYIHSNFWGGSKPGLERTEKLLGMIGNPQNELSFIHVAGTNGKGSFCSMLSSVLNEEGLRVGTYTSPYILRFNERMKVCGKDIPDETLAELTEWIKPFADSMEDKPTEFELITAIAMEYFRRERCEVVVLECGMGGRLDSTNVIQNPLLSVITGIALDHTAFLGNTIEAIAAEKAGIIKKGCPVLYCGKDKNAEKVIRDTANRIGAPLHTFDRSGLTIHDSTLKGTTFTFGRHDNLFLPLLGSYQPENAQNVLIAVDILNGRGLSISDRSIRSGLEKAKWPARFEAVRKDPLILCDGGHNPEGIDSAVDSVKLYFGTKKLIVITGVMADKDHEYMSGRLCEIAKKVYCITPENPRALSGDEYAKEFSARGIPARGMADTENALKEAIRSAVAENCAVLCVGSLYMYSQVIDALKKA